MSSSLTHPMATVKRMLQRLRSVIDRPIRISDTRLDTDRLDTVLLDTHYWTPHDWTRAVLDWIHSYVFDRTKVPVEKMITSNMFVFRLKSFEVQLKRFVSHSINCN